MSGRIEERDHSGAVILRFSRKRGRPRSAKPTTDHGTPELIRKRSQGDTTEALDLCLHRDIITPTQHWCGIHLRWLYTLRYGAPGVRAIDPMHLGGIEIKIDDLEWRSAREREYHDIMKQLMHSGHALSLMNLCIYNERPAFLSLHMPVTAKRQEQLTELLAHIRDGLDILVKHWRRSRESS